jgi:putative transposase
MASDLDRRVALVERLASLREQGRLTAALVRAAARAAGVHERTVWRWVAQGRYTPRPSNGYRLTEADVDALYVAHGQVARAWSIQSQAGAGVPSRRSFHRAVTREMSLAERAYAREGENGRRRYEVYRRWEPKARNEVWEADHVELDVEVLPLRGTRRVRPWMTVVEDGFSRLIMGWALSLRPTSAEVLAALRLAIVIDPERGGWGGVPVLVRFDGGKEFLARAITRAAGELGCAALPAAPYSPHLKGKVERLARTINQELCAQLPFYTGAPRRRDGQMFAQPAPLTLAQLQSRVADWVSAYNTSRPHGALGGLTPAQRWVQSSAPLDVVEPERLRWMLMADVSRRMLKDGIHFGGEVFIAPELGGLGGELVEVRYMPYDLRSIEVFIAGRWICTARPQDALSPEQAELVIAQRRNAARDMSRRKARASRKARSRVAPMTGEGAIEEITIPTRRSTARKQNADRASTEVLRVLGLADRLNKPQTPAAKPKRETAS